MATPLKKFRAGNVSAAIWENEAQINGKSVTVLKCTIDRRYEKDGKWFNSNSYGRNEIPLAIHCLAQAYATMVGERSVRNGDETQEELVE